MTQLTIDTGDGGDKFNFFHELKTVDIKYERKIQDISKFPEAFSDMGMVLRGRTDDGTDIHLWTFLYIQRGQEIIVDGDVTQTFFIASKYTDEEKQQMHDNYFVNKGQNIEDYGKVGDITVDESDPQKVVWSAGLGRTFTCTPPEWRVTGNHAGVETDIKLKAITPGNFHCGVFEDVKPHKPASAGYIMHTAAEGTIKVDGKTHKFKGFAVHERIINTGRVFDRTEYMGGRGMNWCHSWSEGLSFWCFNGDVAGSNGFTGMLQIEGQTFGIGAEDGSIEEVEYWIDPKSRVLTPRVWKCKIRCKLGTMESTVTGYARGFYTWIRKNGTLLVNQVQCDSKTVFHHKDGRVIEANQMSLIEHMRTLYRQDERP